MGKLIPIVLALLGIGVGGGAGYVMRTQSEAAALATDGTSAEDMGTETGGGATGAAADGAQDPGLSEYTDGEFVQFSNQFVIPLVEDESVSAIMILSLSVETAPGTTEAIYARQPRLRDAFLRVLFDHASVGGFSGNFLNSADLDDLRSALREIAVSTAGPVVRDVLIVDLVKQSL